MRETLTLNFTSNEEKARRKCVKDYDTSLVLVPAFYISEQYKEVIIEFIFHPLTSQWRALTGSQNYLTQGPCFALHCATSPKPAHAIMTQTLFHVIKSSPFIPISVNITLTFDSVQKVCHCSH